MTPDSPAAALEMLRQRIEPVGTERIAITEAAGRVLAGPLWADRPSPATDVSAMDGFAVRLEDLACGILPIAGEIRIGQCPADLGPGTALRIVTGGPLPPGADTVVRREDVEEDGGTIRIPDAKRARLEIGADIRRIGENGGAGALVVAAGTPITTAVAGGVASFADEPIEVRRRVRVAVLVTGDELVSAGAPATPWQVRDSNGPTLRIALDAPWVTLRVLPSARDDERALRQAIALALEESDALVLTGGVSMGVRDHVPDALRAAGVDVLFHRLPIRPGKPLLGGVADGGRPVLALPGNPISVLVTARRFACASIAWRAGVTRVVPPGLVRLAPPASGTIGLWWHRPVRLHDDGTAELVATRGSGDVVAIARSDGFVEVPPGASGEGPFPYYAW